MTQVTSHWLVKNGHVLASLEVADSRWSKARGLLGRSGLEGAMLFPRARSVHTLGMRFGLDVAFLDQDNTVLKIVTLPPNRVTGFHLHASSVLEAEAGTFAGWGIQVGDTLEVSEECR